MKIGTAIDRFQLKWTDKCTEHSQFSTDEHRWRTYEEIPMLTINGPIERIVCFDFVKVYVLGLFQVKLHFVWISCLMEKLSLMLLVFI